MKKWLLFIYLQYLPILKYIDSQFRIFAPGVTLKPTNSGLLSLP